MESFELQCNCGSCNTGIFSCTKRGTNAVIITYICNSCGNMEEVVQYLYKDKYLNERYCTVAESLEESLKEMQLMRRGKLPKKSLKESKQEWDIWVEETEEELKQQ